jgi:adenylyltransferase/sulfurtransferase
MRYSRQIKFKEISKKGQNIINKSQVSIVGVGGLGSTCAELLTRAGIGNITIIDHDIVKLHNLQRQTLYNENDIGKIKVIQAKNNLKKINSEIKIIAKNIELNKKNIDILKQSDTVLGCTDNLKTRFLINDFCLKNKIPWIHTGAIKTFGNLLNVITGEVCFRCVFPRIEKLKQTSETVGILNTICTVIGSLQATQAIKILLKEDYEKNLVYFNIWNNKLRKINVKKNPECPACNGRYEFLI